MKKRKENSRPDTILRLILLYGEMPYSLLDLLAGDPSRRIYVHQAIASLKSKMLVRSTGSYAEGTKALRLIASEMNQEYVIEKYGPEMIENIRRITSDFRYSGTRPGDRKRWHRMCETGVMVHEAGLMDYNVESWREEELIDLHGLTEVEAQEAGILPEPVIIPGMGLVDARGNWYMGATEYRRRGLSTPDQMKYWGFTGMLYGGGRPYMLYSTGSSLATFSAHAERLSRYTIELYMQHREPVLRRQQGLDQVLNTAVLFGAPGTDLPYEYLTRGAEKLKEDKAAFILRNVRKVYDNVCYVPLDQNGVRQMKMYLRSNWKNEMFNIYEGLEPVKLNQYEEYYDAHAYDAMDDQGRYVLFFLDGNLHNLYRFKVFRYNDPEHKHIVCFPWQHELVAKYISNTLVTISTCEPWELEEYFGDG